MDNFTWHWGYWFLVWFMCGLISLFIKGFALMLSEANAKTTKSIDGPEVFGAIVFGPIGLALMSGAFLGAIINTRRRQNGKSRSTRARPNKANPNN